MTPNPPEERKPEEPRETRDSAAGDPVAILCIEDSDDDYWFMVRELEKAGFPYRCHRVCGQEALTAALAAGHWDLVLSDYSVPGLYFPHVLGQIRKHSSNLPVILVSGTLGEVKAAAMIKLGARDYVPKDNLADLLPAIRRHVNR